MISDLGQQISYQQVLTILLWWKKRSTESKLHMPLMLKISYLDMLLILIINLMLIAMKREDE